MSEAIRLALAAISGQRSPQMTTLVDLLNMQSRGLLPSSFVRSPSEGNAPPKSYVPPPRRSQVEVFDAGLAASHLTLARILVHLAAQTSDPGAWVNREAAVVDQAVDHLRDRTGNPLSAEAAEAVRVALATIYAAAKAGADVLP